MDDGWVFSVAGKSRGGRDGLREGRGLAIDLTINTAMPFISSVLVSVNIGFFPPFPLANQSVHNSVVEFEANAEKTWLEMRQGCWGAWRKMSCSKE